MHHLDTSRTPPSNALATHAGMRRRLTTRWRCASTLDGASTYARRKSGRVDIGVRLNSS